MPPKIPDVKKPDTYDTDEARPRYETPSYDAGKCFLDDIDNIAEVLAFAEGEAYRQ